MQSDGNFKFILEYTTVLSAMILWIVLLHYLSTNYLEKSILLWYAEEGFKINTFFTIISALWGDLNKRTRMISANPYEYLSSYSRFIAGFFAASAQL